MPHRLNVVVAAPATEVVDSTQPRTSTAPRRREVHESVATIVAKQADDASALCARVRATLPRGNTPLAVFLFGRSAALAAARALLERDADAREWPLLAVEGCPCHDGAFAGVQVYFAPAVSVRRVRVAGRVVGSVFDDGEARHCVLAGLAPRSAQGHPADQARAAFENLEAALDTAGFGLGDLVRTWFYNRRILEWYGDFNRVRAAAYGRVTFQLGAHPASTGIEGTPSSDTALELAAWAMRPKTTDARMVPLDSPLQCPAPRYGSLFSRAAEMHAAGRERIFVSGTASIAPGGESVWPGDPARQIDQTMRVIEALLATRGMGLADVDRAIAYFKNGSDYRHFVGWLRGHGLAGLPFLAMQCDVCRDDLLFELEADAARTRP